MKSFGETAKLFTVVAICTASYKSPNAYNVLSALGLLLSTCFLPHRPVLERKLTPCACYSVSISRNVASLAEDYGCRQRLEPHGVGSHAQEAPCRCDVPTAWEELPLTVKQVIQRVSIWSTMEFISTPLLSGSRRFPLEGRASEETLPTNCGLRPICICHHDGCTVGAHLPVLVDAARKLHIIILM